MNQRFLSVLAFAFVVAAGASFLLYRLMAGRVTTKAAPATAKVVVAERNLELGTVLQEADLKFADWAGTMAAGSSSRKADFIGRGVVSKIYANEPILENRLAAKGAGGGLAAMIPPGMRAVAVRVNEVVGVAGFVTPGSRVDVLISGNPPGAANNRTGNVTKTLLQNIEVMSAGQDFKKDSEGKPVVAQVVNLLVTPEQAEVMSLAVSQTTIQLVLRNPLDMQLSKTTGAALASIFGGGVPKPAADRAEPRPRRSVSPPPSPAAPVAAKEPPKQPFVMEIISGGKRVQAKFTEVPAEAK